jgi:hypothetical protein
MSVGVVVLLASCGKSNSGTTASAMSDPDRLSFESPELPAGWSIVPAPSRRDLDCAERSQEAWQVKIDGAKVHVTEVHVAKAEQRDPDDGPPLPFALPYDEPKHRKHVLAFSDGFLVGTDAGEWGGELLWFNQDGTHSARITFGNVIGMVALGADEVLVLEGLNHMGIGEGAVRWVVRDHGAWRSARTKKLDSGPELLIAEADAVYAVTLTSVVRIKRDRTVDIMQPLDTPPPVSTGSLIGKRDRVVPVVQPIDVSYLLYLHPGSVAVDPVDQIWIGMRHYVVRMTRSGARYKLTWLANGACT